MTLLDRHAYDRPLDADALAWAHEAEEGDYLAEYADDGLDAASDSGNRCGYDDETLDAIGRVLRERGLVLRADDCGLVVEAANVS